MTAVGGSLESVTLNGRIFAVAADAEVQRKVGGKENEFAPNGDGGGRLIQTRVGWSLDGFAVEIDDSRGDHEFLQELSDLQDFYPVAATYASGAVWQGTGQLMGETQMSSQSTTAAVSLGGPGKLTQQ